ncbi:M20/M25/M40 family metallo-hydrolase [Bradyrhizobium sp. CCBAU 53380]|uniref:M20/M25/M40 family metallo-hydrolase n=1 Tax=Bradyrhizobium sp. CCBAU 53380 TaxID=1325117 RepID=UPI002302D931|nr:M20/M25/M40 family metallo-hydrolase [Bradyrhizobium sp. CCBAU 53380]MDA9421016.1 hypothetical protein [Bradyrhizobium sp. CCBAU 53380]
MLDRAIALAREERDMALSNLCAAVRIPSIGAASAHRPDMLRNAEFVANRLRSMGAEVRVLEVISGKPPVVRGDLLIDPALPTLTIYGHYDVQPVDPLEDWVSPPFEPEVRDHVLYGRGACDSKGNHMAAIQGVDCLKRSCGLGLNVRFLIEGEEETTGQALPAYLRENAKELTSDYVLVLDGSFHQDGYPILATGMRGELYVEIYADGPDHDLHSGHYGGVSPNPANTLARILGALKDREGKVTIPGFYDDIKQIPAVEIQDAQRSQEYGEIVRKRIGAVALEGEAGFLPIERQWLRPTLDVNGMVSGFTGEGEKTIIPATAMAKLSMRLVPGQDPDKIYSQLVRYVSELGTPGVQLRIEKLGACKAFVCSAAHKAGEAASTAFETSFGQTPLPVRKGSSIPVVADLIETIGGQMVLTGIGNPDSRVHSPNENIRLDHFHKGTEMIIRFVHALRAA